MSISVYPRWRGEHAVQNFLKRFNCGLSPLARGTHRPRTTIRANRRFIPAGAGNTALSFSYYRPATVYPRWRGEHYRTDCRILFFCGLSPLARGTLPYRLPDIIFLRFIPAGAGNTCCSSWWSAAIAVYPRWRGEHNVRLSPLCVVAGLSPLARGTRRDYSKEDAGDRFIPAGAGNTFKYVYLLIAISGLSPLARGTPALFAALSLVARFIPAGAGNARTRRSSSRKNAVYPRWRGEHSKHNLLLINDFLSQSQSTNFIVSHKQHIHYVKEHLIH